MNKAGLKVTFRKYGLGLTIVWTCILAAILTFTIYEYHKDTIKEVTREARDYHDLNLQYRKWAPEPGASMSLLTKFLQTRILPFLTGM